MPLIKKDGAAPEKPEKPANNVEANKARIAAAKARRNAAAAEAAEPEAAPAVAAEQEAVSAPAENTPPPPPPPPAGDRTPPPPPPGAAKDGNAPPPPPDPAKIDEIAREVISGKWGNGNERVEKLKAAGYDPSLVQQRVNQLLK